MGARAIALSSCSLSLVRVSIEGAKKFNNPIRIRDAVRRPIRLPYLYRAMYLIKVLKYFLFLVRGFDGNKYGDVHVRF